MPPHVLSDVQSMRASPTRATSTRARIAVRLRAAQPGNAAPVAGTHQSSGKTVQKALGATSVYKGDASSGSVQEHQNDQRERQPDDFGDLPPVTEHETRLAQIITAKAALPQYVTIGTGDTTYCLQHLFDGVMAYGMSDEEFARREYVRAALEHVSGDFEEFISVDLLLSRQYTRYDTLDKAAMREVTAEQLSRWADDHFTRPFGYHGLIKWYVKVLGQFGDPLCPLNISVWSVAVAVSNYKQLPRVELR